MNVPIGRTRWPAWRVATALLLTVANLPVAAQALTGTHQLTLRHDAFKDFFLSMKEFKCLQAPAEIFCHVPYPYAQPGTVSADDLAWLEHALLFMFKTPGDFGAKLWNGVYFQLRASERGLEGRPQAVDLNHISAPPERLDRPPFGPAQRDDIAPGARFFNRLTLE